MKGRHKSTKDEARALSTYVRLLRAAESVSARIHSHLSEAGLTVSQFGVLEALYEMGPLSQVEIAKKIVKSSGNITMVIDNLEKRGLVKRERDQEDRRSYSIHLTAAGRKTIGTLFPRHAGRVELGMRALTKVEQDTLGNLCRKLGVSEKR